MRPVEGRVDLSTTEATCITLQVGPDRVEARSGRARNRPSGRADSNVHRSCDAIRTNGAMGHWEHGRIAKPLRARPACRLPLSRQRHHQRRGARAPRHDRPDRVCGLRDAWRCRTSACRLLRPIGTIAPDCAVSCVLLPLRAALAEWAGVDADAFAMALINEYRPGSPIGWHRDAPHYDIVAGVSLLSACRMKFRPSRPLALTAADSRQRWATHEIVLLPRSAYLMTQESRHGFEHHIPPVAALRYSVTFRTLR